MGHTAEAGRQLPVGAPRTAPVEAGSGREERGKGVAHTRRRDVEGRTRVCHRNAEVETCRTPSEAAPRVWGAGACRP